jgi:hypothetical protein
MRYFIFCLVDPVKVDKMEPVNSQVGGTNNGSQSTSSRHFLRHSTCAMHDCQHVDLVLFDSVDDPVWPFYHLSNIVPRVFRNYSSGPWE